MKDLQGFYEKDKLINFYRQMYLLRNFEEVAANMYLKGKIGGFTHLYIGQEATGVGAIAALFDKDYVVSAYREHGHAIAKGIPAKAVMAELFGKQTGCSGGMGGSMHLFDKNVNFMGGYAIVGGSIPIAVGIGFSINYREEELVCACFFGDGAINEGAFNEGLNMAKLYNLPILFICENNLYGMGTGVVRASSVSEIHKRASGFNMPSKAINGMDVIEVYEEILLAVKAIRRGGGPHFIEARTYRFKPHSMADPDRYRTLSETEMWRERDPIENYSRRLIEQGIAEADELKQIKESVEIEVQEAVEFAEQSPEPEWAHLKELVYSE